MNSQDPANQPPSAATPPSLEAGFIQRGADADENMSPSGRKFKQLVKNDHFSKIVNEQIQNIAFEIQSKMKADLTIINHETGQVQVEQRQQAQGSQPNTMRSDQSAGVSANAPKYSESDQAKAENESSYAHDQTASTKHVTNTPNFNDNSTQNQYIGLNINMNMNVQTPPPSANQ